MAPGTPPAGDLGNIRESIDAIDARIHALLNERARFAQLVGISVDGACWISMKTPACSAPLRARAAAGSSGAMTAA